LLRCPEDSKVTSRSFRAPHGRLRRTDYAV
jgi:hypothetical protein